MLEKLNTNFDRCRCGPHCQCVIFCIYSGSCASSPAWHCIMRNSYAHDVKYIYDLHIYLACCTAVPFFHPLVTTSWINHTHLHVEQIIRLHPVQCYVFNIFGHFFVVNTEDCSVVWLMQVEVHPKYLAVVLFHCLCWSLVGKVICTIIQLMLSSNPRSYQLVGPCTHKSTPWFI